MSLRYQYLYVCPSKASTFVLVKRTNTDSFSDTKSETRVTAKICHHKYSELFPQRASRVLERMNHQLLRVVREPEQPEQRGDAEGEDKDKKNDVPKRKQRIISVSPERKAGSHFTRFTSTRVQILTRIPRAQRRPAYLLALLVQKYKY